MPELSLTMNEEEKFIPYASFPIYEIHTVEPIIFCVDTGAPYSCIGDKALGRIVRHSESKCIPLIDYKCDFKISQYIGRIERYA